MRNPHRFSIRHYSRTLEQYLLAGYSVVPFRDLSAVAGPKVLILRHDIDISPTLAAPVLAAELELGVRSTVFVRTSAPGYDLKDPHIAAQLTGLLDDGFEIGLHYSIPRGDKEIRSTLEHQKLGLEKCIGTPVHGAAPHRIATIGSTVPADIIEAVGLSYDAFSPVFTGRYKYLSDSRRRWREGCFCRWIDRTDRMQVLTHPVWWERGSLARKDEILSLL